MSAGGIVPVWLTERQWDIVREACYERGTKVAVAVAERIWDQGGGVNAPKGNS